MKPDSALTGLFDTIDSAIADLTAGKMVVVVDAEDRENEGDLVMAAEDATPEAVNFIIKNARGLLCAPMPSEWLRRLKLDQMVDDNTARHSTKFSVSVDILEGATTGISSSDRSKTLLALADKRTVGEAFGRPGHIFPLEAADGGLSERPGHTEAVVELCKLAGKSPVGALCEILSDDGTMARTTELRELADKWKLKLISIESLMKYMQEHDSEARSTVSTEPLEESASTELIEVQKEVEAELPTQFGAFQLHVFNSPTDGKEHLAITKGDIAGQKDVLTRIHSECLTGDMLGSARCDCGSQLQLALEHIEREGMGIVLYMRQEGRGIGLTNKIKAYALQDKGSDTVEANVQLGFEADQRDYAISAAMLRELGVDSVTLMTNNPAKISGLLKGGVAVNERRSAETTPTPENRAYLRTKRDKLGHLLEMLEPAVVGNGNGSTNGNGSCQNNGNGTGRMSAASQSGGASISPPTSPPTAPRNEILSESAVDSAHNSAYNKESKQS